MKILYKIETELSLEDYKKMVKCCYPFLFWSYFIKLFIYSIGIFSLLCFYPKDSFVKNIFYCLFVISVIIIILKFNWNKILVKLYQRSMAVLQKDTVFTVEFYKKQFRYKRKYGTNTIEYNCVKRIVETKTHFYLFCYQYFLPIVKEKCEPQLIDFIRNINKSVYHLQKKKKI